jgi:type VI protein secretion system component VasK
MPQRRMFLERRSYRMRRMMDALRFLPLIGLCLWMVPLLWPLPEAGHTDPMPMSVALKYLFGVWLALVVMAWALWRYTRGQAEADAAQGPSDRAA